MCENCKNAKLCKYKEDVEKFLRSGFIVNTRTMRPECLEPNWKCKYFEEDAPETKGKIPTISDCGYKYNEYNWDEIIKGAQWDEILKDAPRESDIMKNPCSLCEWYKQRLADPTPYIGDSPCQWCTKSPYRLTCNAATETRPEDVQTTTTTSTKPAVDLDDMNEYVRRWSEYPD